MTRSCARRPLRSRPEGTRTDRPTSRVRLPWRAAAAACLFGGFLASALTAGVCQVPATYATLQAAIDDASCTSIEVAAGSFAEAPYVARSVSIAGAGIGATVVGGQVLVQSSGTVVTFSDLTVETPCDPALVVRRTSRFIPQGVAVQVPVSGPCLISDGIFADGFEAGTTAAWSASAP